MEMMTLRGGTPSLRAFCPCERRSQKSIACENCVGRRTTAGGENWSSCNARRLFVEKFWRSPSPPTDGGLRRPRPHHRLGPAPGAPPPPLRRGLRPPEGEPLP